MPNRPKSDAAAQTKERPPPEEPLTKKELDENLDHALKETFPSSDPIAVGQPTGDEVLKEQTAKALEREEAEAAAKQPADAPLEAPAREKQPKRKAPAKHEGSG